MAQEKSENKFKGPTFRYGPNGESEVFNHSADVPEGWKNHPSDFTAPPPAPAKAAPPAPPVQSLTKKEMRAALAEGGIQFDPNASAKELNDLLVEKMKAVLTEAEIAFDPAADAKTLLGLLQPSE